MKLAIFSICVLTSLVTGCGYVQRLYTHYTGDTTTKCAETGIKYLQSDSGLAVLLDKEGKTVPCQP